MTDPRPELVMSCDAPGRCLNLVARAPRLVVPSRSLLATGHRPVRVMTTLHYCQPHADRQPLKPSDLLDAKLKAKIEQHARLTRPLDWRPDFERAWIQWVLVTTPEYRAFLRNLGIGRVYTA